MEINLPPEQRELVDRLVASGRYGSVDDVVSEGIRLLSTSEELRKHVQLGIDQADRGEVIDHEAVFSKLRLLASAYTDAS